MPSFVGHVVCHDCGHKITVSLCYSPGLLSTNTPFHETSLASKTASPVFFFLFLCLDPNFSPWGFCLGNTGLGPKRTLRSGPFVTISLGPMLSLQLLEADLVWSLSVASRGGLAGRQSC